MSLLWPYIFADNQEIFFAHHSFKWTNNAKYNAGVTCIIVGVRNTSSESRFLFDGNRVKVVKGINAYLTEGANTIVASANVPLSHVPQMNFGNMPADGGCLILDEYERQDFLEQQPEAEKFIKPLIGSEEFINGKHRWCLWLYGEPEEQYCHMRSVMERINRLRDVRLKSSRPQLANIPHLFAQITQPMGCSVIVIPCVSSENRSYIPIGYLEQGNIVANSCML